MNKYIQQTAAQMEKILRTSATAGLSPSAVSEAQARYGKNLVFPKTPTSFGSFLVQLFKRISFYVMVLAILLAVLTHHVVEACAVGAIYVFFLGFSYLLYRYRAKKKRSLYLASSASVRAIRGGRVYLVSPEELVVGDLIELRAGDVLYADAYVVTEGEMEVFCKREHFHETLVKHGGACFEGVGEAFNLLCVGDVVRAGEGRALVTAISATPPIEEREDSLTEKTQKKLCRLAVRLSASITVLALLIAGFLTMHDAALFARIFLCAAVICAISPCAWSELLYDCLFFNANEKIRSRRYALFTSMQAVEDTAKGDAFLLPTKSIFQGSRYVVRAYENGAGTRITENGKQSTEELSLISAALLAIHKENASSGYEKYLLAFCKKHADKAPFLKLGTVLASPSSKDISIASFQNQKDGRSFSFVAGDPEELLSYMLYISEDGRVRLLDEQTKSRMLSAVRKLKKDGHRLVAYAETQTRISGNDFPFLSKDMKLLGFFVLSELPDRRITDALKWVADTGKKAFFFHNGENPDWIIDALPLLKNAPIIDGHAENFTYEILAYAKDKNLPFAIGIHMSAEQQSQLAHVLENESYQTVAYGMQYSDHRLMCAAALAIAPIKELRKESVGIVQESAAVYAKEHVASQIGAVKEAAGLIRSFGVSTAYFCASLLARSALFLFGAIFGKLFLAPVVLAVFSSVIDLLAFWCLSHVKSANDGTEEIDSARHRNLGLVLGILFGALVTGALALWMAAVPSFFPFSYAAFSFAALLFMLNVGVLRFASVRYSASVLLFPLVSLAACLVLLLAESVGMPYAYFSPVFPFWVLAPTVVLLGVGKAVELGMQSREEKAKSNHQEFKK